MKKNNVISHLQPNNCQEYTFSLYKESDNEAVIELMQEVFSTEKMRKAKNFSLEFWRWQYKYNPWGQSIIILAKDRNKVVGQYANVPMRLKYDDRILNTALAADLMVKETHRRKGLFKKMGEVSNTTLSNFGISLSIAFPSRSESYSGFINKLGWFVVGDLGVLVKPIFFNMFHKKNKGIRIEQISIFPENINDLWEQLNSGINIGIVRRKEYLDWRYFSRPGASYKVFLVYRNNIPVGYFVIKVITVSKIKVGIIVDLLCVNELNIIQSIIFKTTGIFLESGAYLCIVLKNKLNEAILKKLGFLLLPRCFSPKQYTLIARINKEIPKTVMVKNIDNWYLTFGDWDVV